MRQGVTLRTGGGLALALAGLGAHAAAPALISVPADNPAVVYEGRCAPDGGGGVRLGFPGVTAHLRFDGSDLSLQAWASAIQFLDVRVDSGRFSRLELRAGDGTYPLAAGLGIGPHTLTLVRDNESWQGVCTYRKFLLAPGAELLAPPALPARKLTFIGDSVTCGELDVYQPGMGFQDSANTDARVSYGMILARRLKAQCHLVSYGGRGIMRDWQGIRHTNNAPQFYERTLPDDPDILWDHSRYVPDAIGVQLGSNDFGSGIPDQTEFVDAYVEFVRILRRDAPHALIFLMQSPILRDDPQGPKRTVLDAYLDEIVAQLHDPRVVLAPLKVCRGVPGNGHPTGAEHREMADELEPLLRRDLGWK